MTICIAMARTGSASDGEVKGAGACVYIQPRILGGAALLANLG